MARSVRIGRSQGPNEAFRIISKTSNLFTREQQFQDRLKVSRANNEASFQERISARQAQESNNRASQNLRAQQAKLRSAAASIRAQFAATASSRLLAEFEAGRKQKQALRQRQQDTAVGKAAAQFGASGVSSIGAQLEARRQSVLQGNVQASADNTQKEQILNQARQAITGAFAGGLSAAASGGSISRAFGSIFRREVSGNSGIKTNITAVRLA